MTTQITAPHEVRDAEKLASITASMSASGWTGHPVLVIEIADRMQALTGSHRIAAARAAGIEIETHEIEDAELTDDQRDTISYRLGDCEWLSEAISSCHDDDDIAYVLEAVLGDDATATRIMLAEIAQND